MEQDFQDKTLFSVNGFSFLIISALSLISLLVIVYYGYFIVVLPISIMFLIFAFITPGGFFINSPNEAKVVEFFGKYIGTEFKSGFFFTIPFTQKKSISLKIRNINTDKMKVNDLNGNPIEIAAVIVWKVINPAKTCLNISNYQDFIFLQSESSIRELSGSYPYDSEDENVSLRQNSTRISQELKSMLQSKLEVAGIEMIDAKISHLAYSSEIAQVMLKRQQAKALTSAKQHIVRNAISMVDEILEYFEQNNIVKLSDMQKIKLINNLLVALISEQGTQPTLALD